MSKLNENIDKKLTKIRERYRDGVDFVSESEKELARLMVQEEFGKHPIVIKLVEQAQKKVDQINGLLMYDEKLDQDSELRKALKHQRAVHLFYISSLSGKSASAKRQAIEDEINRLLGDDAE